MMSLSKIFGDLLEGHKANIETKLNISLLSDAVIVADAERVSQLLPLVKDSKYYHEQPGVFGSTYSPQDNFLQWAIRLDDLEVFEMLRNALKDPNHRVKACGAFATSFWRLEDSMLSLALTAQSKRVATALLSDPLYTDIEKSGFSQNSYGNMLYVEPLALARDMPDILSLLQQRLEGLKQGKAAVTKLAI